MDPIQDAICYRARIAREESVQPFERAEALVSVLPKMGGWKSQEESHMEGVYNYFGRRKLNLYSNEPVGSLLKPAAHGRRGAEPQTLQDDPPARGRQPKIAEVRHRNQVSSFCSCCRSSRMHPAWQASDAGAAATSVAAAATEASVAQDDGREANDQARPSKRKATAMHTESGKRADSTRRGDAAPAAAPTPTEASAVAYLEENRSRMGDETADGAAPETTGGGATAGGAAADGMAPALKEELVEDEEAEEEDCSSL